ncbi:hypothetical protein [Allobranchiibius sp. GilTou73]|uniref:hypothetical protein n=1 Tax=Allobranchiibius sp. GilTou73 TaxID=2904523 RepID=UPI001F367FB0|nr:hypothetical protein [Allobranchiibius sp. GilTou73]UIJ34586.1 hypothetical protein LVQ62_16020 [Allobranchiibius sp. GilTou73]
MSRSRAALGGCLMGAAGILLTACSGGGGAASYDGPSSWPVQTATGVFTTGAVDPGSSARAAVSAPSTWNLTRSTPGDPNVDPSSWPDAATVFTDKQLVTLFPEAAKVKTPSCTKLTLPGGVKTPRNSSCTWSVSLPESGGTVSTVTLSFHGFGADGPMTAAWLAEERTQITGRITGDVFFTPGTFGAKGAYFLSNMHSSVLVSNGKNAAWIDLDFSGFYQAFGNNADKTLAGLRTQVFPVLVEDLVGRLPRTNEGVPLVGTATGTTS